MCHLIRTWYDLKRSHVRVEIYFWISDSCMSNILPCYIFFHFMFFRTSSYCFFEFHMNQLSSVAHFRQPKSMIQFLPEQQISGALFPQRQVSYWVFLIIGQQVAMTCY